MNFVDHIFILLLFVVQPIYDTGYFRRFCARVDAGEPDPRSKFYKDTMLTQWLFFAVLATAWYFFDRSVANLGFVAIEGLGFWIGAALLVLISGILLSTWHSAKQASDDERNKTVESLGKLVHIMPHTRGDLRLFIQVSVTAGIVEEIVYRGFLLWYLTQMMPMWAAVIVSSVGFGLAHSYQGVNGAIRCGLLGLALAALYVATGSIWLPIIAHAILDILQGGAISELLRTDQNRDLQPQNTI